MKCPRCQQENPTQAKFCLECGASIKAPHESAPLAASSADLQRALGHALGQQAATSEILRVISQSPTDVQPVFDTIVRSAARLLDAPGRADGDDRCRSGNGRGGSQDQLPDPAGKRPRPQPCRPDAARLHRQ
jgi:hypothetical protein